MNVHSKDVQNKLNINNSDSISSSISSISGTGSLSGSVSGCAPGNISGSLSSVAATASPDGGTTGNSQIPVSPQGRSNSTAIRRQSTHDNELGKSNEPKARCSSTIEGNAQDQVRTMKSPEILIPQ